MRPFGIVAAGIISALTLAGSTQAQDVTAGKKVFKKCAACHKIGAGAKNATGPILTDVVGRTAGRVQGYKYSKAMQQSGDAGLVWTNDLIDSYITDPRKFLRAFLKDPKAKAKMSFKLKDADRRRDVIAYLGSFQTAVEAQNNQVCVRNGSTMSYFFTAEAGDGTHVSGILAPEEKLCTTAKDDHSQGVVSVFVSDTVLEGCSRLVAVGKSDKLLQYSDFDRCLWASNAS